MQEFNSLTDALKNSTLSELLKETLGQVKNHPQDIRARELLFKLYCVDGAWNKALVQLQTLVLMDEERKKQTELYKNLVFSEVQRLQILTGARQPVSLKGDLPAWAIKLHEANNDHYQGRSEQSAARRDEAFGMAPESAGNSGALGDFSWIADSDSRLGPICEFICAGGYRWLPFSAIHKLSVLKPEKLLDLLWLPATITTEGEQFHGYIPARYPLNKDDSQEIKLGAKTEWLQASDSLSVGCGRKVIITDTSELSIMEIDDVIFE